MLGKLNCYIRKLGILLTAFALIAVMAGCDGNPSQDLEIRTWYDLDEVRNNLAGHHVLMNDLDPTTAGYAALASPTANGGRGWQNIGVFRGTFDGQGHEIRGLFVNQPDYDHGGLFSLLYKGVINDIGVVNLTVIGKHYTGGLLGENDQGTISNSYCTGSVAGDAYVGGLVGFNKGTVSSSYFGGSVTSDGYHVGGLVGANQRGTITNAHYNYDEVLINGEHIITTGAMLGEDFDEWLSNGESLDINVRLSQEDGYYIVDNITDFKQLLPFGQDDSLKFKLTSDLDLADEPNFYIPYLAGEFHGDGYKVSNLSLNFSSICQVGLFGYLASSGTVNEVAAENASISAYERVGGLVGSSEGTVSDSHCTGSVTGAGWWVGGLVGYSLGAVTNSYSAGNVTGDYFVGGLVGYQDYGTISESYSTVSVASGGSFAGGLAGDAWKGTVSNSYATGNVTSSEAFVGGLVGDNSAAVSNSYSTGRVTGLSHVGGLMGANYGTVSNSFWDIQTSGQSTSAAGTGKSTAEMRDVVTFSGAGWNIIAVALNETNTAYIWNIVDEATYPFLSWQP
jgi:hypothetical protein